MYFLIGDEAPESNLQPGERSTKRILVMVVALHSRGIPLNRPITQSSSANPVDNPIGDAR
jgi:hypothetical protein